MSSEMRFRTLADASLSRHETREGKDWLVVPVVAVVEGVLNGEYLSAEEIEASTQYWSDVPLPVYHPVVNGQKVSAKSLAIIESMTIGRLYNVYYENRSLKGEMWIDIAKATELGGEALQVLQRLQAGEVVEVSTAYVATITDTSGVFNGEKYNGVQSNLRPDHLALLPNAIGACSVADGCGANRTNEAGENMACKMCVQLREGESMNDRREAVELAIPRVAGQYVWIADLYENRVVYEVADAGYMQAPYTINDEGIVVLGAAVKVKRTVDYEEIKENVMVVAAADRSIIGKIKTLLGGGKMSKREENVLALRANGVDLSDELLDKTPDEVLEVMAANSKPVDPAPVVPPEPAGVTVNEILKAKGVDLDKVVDYLKTQEAEADRVKKGYIDALIACERCQISNEALQAMDASVLRELSASFIPGNYVGVGIPRSNETVPAAPGIVVNAGTKDGE